MNVEEALLEQGIARREYAKSVSARLFTGRVAEVERAAAQAHESWHSHVASCASCRYFPKGCEIGNRLDWVATVWDRRVEG